MAVKLGNGNWAVKEDKLLAYNDNSGLFFNKEFDFSRGTSATYVAKDGLIKTAGIQPNIVNNGDFSELGSELVTNGDFSDGSSSWVAEGGSSTWVIDNVANKISSSNFALYQNITRTVGKIYKISFDIVEYTSGTLSITLGNGASTSFNTAGSKTVYLEWDGSDDRIRFRSSFIGKIDNVSVKEVGQNWSFGGEAIIDNGLVSFVSASNTYSYIRQDVSSLAASLYKISIEVKNYVSGAVQVGFQGSSPNLQNLNVSADGVYTVELSPNANGDDLEISREFAGGAFDFDVDNVTVQEIQTDTPRIDFTNDTKGHLLLEPSRTNYATYSNDISQFTTVTVGGTLTETANYAEAPNGENEATRLQMSASGSNYSLKSTNTSAFNDDYYGSIYLKSNTTENQEVAIYGRNSVQQSYTVTPQWQRFEVSCNNASGSAFFNFGVFSSFGSDTDLDILAWGGQLEQGDYSTSLINTTGAASTRNADVCNNSGSAQDFNSEEGVLYAEIGALADDGTNRLLSINDSTSSNSIWLYFNTSNSVTYSVRVGGVAQASASHTIDIKTFNKIAIKYKENDFAVWFNGVKTLTDTSGNTYTSGTLNNISFDAGDGALDFYGKVRNLQVFTEALTDEQLEKLTS